MFIPMVFGEKLRWTRWHQTWSPVSINSTRADASRESLTVRPYGTDEAISGIPPFSTGHGYGLKLLPGSYFYSRHEFAACAAFRFVGRGTMLDSYATFRPGS
jgi:hypothetical protein